MGINQSEYHQFRQDLIIRPIKGSDGSVNYVLRDPKARQSFEFDEREYFLCRAFDGATGLSEIGARFQKKFKISISEYNLNCFARELASYGLFQIKSQVEDQATTDGSRSNFKAEEPEKAGLSYGITIWSASNPERWLIFLGQLLRPFRFLVWSLLPLLVLASSILIQNGGIFEQDFADKLQFVPKLFLSIPTLIMNNFLSRGLQGIVIGYCGARIRYLRIFLLFGVLPRLQIDRDMVWSLSQSARLWGLATPILFRLAMFVIGTFLWYHNRTFPTYLATWAQTLIFVNCIGLLVEANPFWNTGTSLGLGWLLTYFSVDRRFLGRAKQVWQFVLYRKPLPRELKTNNILLLLSYGAVATLSSVFILTGILTLAAIILEEQLQGTGVVLFCILIGIIIYQLMSKNNHRPNSQPKGDNAAISDPTKTETHNTESSEPDASMKTKVLQFIKRRGGFLLFSLGGIIVMLLPYPYRVGGEIDLVPLKRQEIQTDLGAKVIEVPFNGGDGQWIEAGTVIAVLKSSNLENDLLTTQEQIKAQEAILKQQQASLAELVATPRPEEVEVAEAALNEAKERFEAAKRRQQTAEQQLKVSRQQLTTAQEEIQAQQLEVERAMTDARFREQEEKRLEELYEEGAISLQVYEDAQRLAALAQNEIQVSKKGVDIAQRAFEEQNQRVQVQKQEVEEQKQNVRSSMGIVEQRRADLNLVLSGAPKDQIEAARQAVEYAQATVSRLQQQMTFFSEETDRQELRMPFDGSLITPNLHSKVGQYLEKGDTFAIAQNSSRVIGIVDVPEIQIDQLSEMGLVEIRFLAYPNRKFQGQIKAIEPTVKTDQMFGQTSINNQSGDTTQYIPDRAGQIVSVIVEIDDDQQLLIPGMSGYAKIRGKTMPVILAFSRPLVRFFQLEFWSWLP